MMAQIIPGRSGAQTANRSRTRVSLTLLPLATPLARAWAGEASDSDCCAWEHDSRAARLLTFERVCRKEFRQQNYHTHCPRASCRTEGIVMVRLAWHSTETVIRPLGRPGNNIESQQAE
jgi:hypothetical protein